MMKSIKTLQRLAFVLGILKSVASQETNTTELPTILVPEDSFYAMGEDHVICAATKFEGTLVSEIEIEEKLSLNTTIPVLNNASFSGSCSGENPIIVISWAKHGELTLTFNKTDEHWALAKMDLSVTIGDIHKTAHASGKDLKYFKAPLGQSLYCQIPHKIFFENVHKEAASSKAYLDINNVRMQAYNVSSHYSSATSESTCGAHLAPDESYFLIGDDNKVCVAVNLDVEFAFNVLSEDGSKMTKNINLPEKASSYGDCGEANSNPRLTIECDDDVNFTLSFEKKHGGEEWALAEMELELNPSKFFHQENEGSSLILIAQDVSMFAAPINHSFSCKEPSGGIGFYTTEGTPAAYAVINSVHMQAFDVPREYGSERICNIIKEAAPTTHVKYINDTAPIAVGLTCAILTLFGVAGFTYYRITHQKKVDYSNM